MITVFNESERIMSATFPLFLLPNIVFGKYEGDQLPTTIKNVNLIFKYFFKQFKNISKKYTTVPII